ncbi:MAG: endonuclease/exonuclease/phosphatase family protein [Planctomycetota bacterium]|nr:endonuclease/exonuclease/phosphatase family protein [Planctomycetota bacterium]
MIDQRGASVSTLPEQPSKSKKWVRTMLACASMAPVAGSQPWSPLEPWFSPFLPHATTLVVLVLIGHLVGRHWRGAGVLTLAGFVGVWSWTNALQFQKSMVLPQTDAFVISAGFANLGISKAPPLGSSDALQDWARENPFDLFGVVECSTSQVEHIRSWQKWHTVHAEPEDDSADGIALFSMHPIRSVKIARTPNARLDHLTAVVNAPGGTFQVELTHPCPPVPGWLHQRQAELDQLSTASASSDWPVLVLGDLNETPFGSSWRDLLTTSGLSAVGPLSMPTWPSQLKGIPVPQWLGIRIDHMLVGSEWEAGPLKIGPKINSDHRPIRAKIWLRHPGEA